MEIGKLIKDQPMSGLEKVVWWTEYVIRNKGAPYLRNPRADVTWAEFLILDVVSFLFGILTVVLYVVYKITRYLFKIVPKSSQVKKKIA